MNIIYQYKILKVTDTSMIVEYTSDGLVTMKMGMPLPQTGDSLENIIKQYAPISIWQPNVPTFVKPEVDTIGEIVPVVVTLEEAKVTKLEQLATWRYAKETKGVKVGDNYFLTTREARTIIFEYYTKIKDGLITSVLFKDGNGVFVSLDSTNINTILVAIDTWVNDCFLEEFDLISQINDCKSIEDLSDIVFQLVIPQSNVVGALPVVTL